MIFFDLLLTYASKIFSIFAAFIGFGILVAIHEFGHFLFAKLFGISTPTFSIGMGPKIFQRTFGKTDFCLSLLPVGGYVEIATQPEEGKPALPHGSYFNDKPYWQKLFVMFGGILFNLVCAFFIYTGVFFHGKPSMQINSFIIKEVTTDSPAERAGLLQNDLIKGFESILFSNQQEISLPQVIAENAGKTVDFIIERQNIQTIVPVALGTAQEGRVLGISYAPQDVVMHETKLSLPEAIKAGWDTTVTNVQSTYSAIKNMFVARSLKGAGGPVMIFSESFKMAERGAKALLLFLAFISINLALINILPLGALDGGQIFFVTLEWIIRRPLPDMIKIGVNIVSLLLFVGLALYLTFFDIIRLFFQG